MGKSTALGGRRGSTYPPVGTSGHQKPCEAQPNQRLPSSFSGGRREYDAQQGERSEEFDSSARKPGQ
jgi:hypothetical protein